MEITSTKIIGFIILIFIIFISWSGISNLTSSSNSNLNSIKELECENNNILYKNKYINCDDNINNDCSEKEKKIWEANKKYLNNLDCKKLSEDDDKTNDCSCIQNYIYLAKEGIENNGDASDTSVSKIINLGTTLSNSEIRNLIFTDNKDYINAALDFTISKESAGKPGLVNSNDNGKGPSFGLFQFNRDGEMSLVTNFIFSHNSNIKSKFSSDFISLVTNSRGKSFSEKDLNDLSKLGSLSAKEQIDFKKFQLENIIKYNVKSVIPSRYDEILSSKKAYIAIFDILNQMGLGGLDGALRYANNKQNDIAKDILDGAIYNMQQRNIDKNIIKGTTMTLAESRKKRNDNILLS